MRSELPQVARHRHRRDWRIRNVILDRTAFALIRIPQQGVQIFVGDAQQRQVKVLSQQSRDLVAELCPKVGDGVIRRPYFRA